MSRTARALDRLADPRSLAGLAGAVGGLGLTFAGVIDAGWWAITGGMYAAGFLTAQITMPDARPATDPVTAPISDMTADLRRLADRVGPQLPADARGDLAGMLADAASIADRIGRMEPGSIDLLPMRQFLGDYAPTTLRNYEAVPPPLRPVRPSRDRRSPDEQIAEQLSVLSRQMKKVVATLAEGDLAAIENQGRFLDERFATAKTFLADE